jgi:isochorismate synthase
MLSVFQKTIDHYTKKLPFVVYCKPDSDKVIGVFQHTDLLHSITNFTENGFAFVSFDGQKNYIIPSDEADVYVENKSSDAYYLSDNFNSEIDQQSQSNFELLVKKGIEAIQNGTFDKVVLSRMESFEISNLDIEIVLNSLNFNYPTAFNYCFFHPKIGMWFGASPEQFLKADENKIQTVALAGTQIYSESIVWEDKEKQEQQFVTDFIAENVQDYCSDLVISVPFTQKAGTIAHIKTTIEATLHAKSDFGKLITQLHPTPAVCGLPKEAAKQFIIANENYDRKFYTGFLGELNIDFLSFKKEKTDLFVNLRCMEIENKKAMVYVGCGITKDSIPEKEFIETVNKSMTIRKVVNLQNK